MPSELFSYMDMIQPMGAVSTIPTPKPVPVPAPWQAPAKCKTMYVNCNLPINSDCCPPGTPGYAKNPPTPTPTPQPKFKPSYVNKGVPAPTTYSYPNCKTGYVPVWTNARPPDNQSCMDPLQVKWMNDNHIMF